MYADTNASGDNPDLIMEEGMARYGDLEDELEERREKVADAFEVLAFGRFLAGSDLSC